MEGNATGEKGRGSRFCESSWNASSSCKTDLRVFRVALLIVGTNFLREFSSYMIQFPVGALAPAYLLPE